MTNYQKITKLIKGAKDILVETQRYEEASIYRWLEFILEKDGKKLSDESLQAIWNIVEATRNKLAKEEGKI
jgi:DNA polymerase III delta subunit